MSKGGGIGSRRMGARMNKGMDRCDVGSHGKQCGDANEVSKGKILIQPEKKKVKHFGSSQDYEDID